MKPPRVLLASYVEFVAIFGASVQPIRKVLEHFRGPTFKCKSVSCRLLRNKSKNGI